MRTRRCLVPLMLAFVAAFVPSSRAQTTPDLEEGTRPYGAYDGGQFDSVNLASGKMNIKIPLISYPQRGGKLKLSFSAIWTNFSARLTELCTPHLPCQFIASRNGGAFGIDSNNSVWVTGVTNPGTGNIDHYQAILSDASTHVFGNTSGTVWESLDATGMRFDASSYVLTDANGVRYTENTNPGYISLVEDPNGNKMSYNDPNTTWTDTFGRSIPDPFALSYQQPPPQNANCPAVSGQPAATEAQIWTVPAEGGGSEQFAFCYTGIPYDFNITYDDENYEAKSNAFVLQSIVLPNGTAWQFAYDSTYANLQSITLPTGGTISYTWNGLAQLCTTSTFPLTYNTAIATRSVNDGYNNYKWTYSGLGPYPTEIYVTDPLGNLTTHTMSSLGNSDMYYEIQTNYYQGQSTHLKNVTTTYNSEPDPTYHASVCKTLANVTPATITTTLPNNKVAQVAKTYDSPGYTVYVGGNQASGTYVYGRVLSETDSDYGSGGPGGTLRTTSTTYEATGSNSYLTNNLLYLPYLVSVSGGGITEQTYYNYDTGSLEASGAPDLDTNPPTGNSRGNATSIEKCINVSCSSNATTAKTYYDTGLPYVVTDPRGNHTTYAYASDSAYAFPHTVTDPMGHYSTYTYDSDSGLMLTAKDTNQQETSYQYDDMWRLSQANYPDGGEATITHDESSFPFTATLTQTMSSSQSKVTTNRFDGVGRVTEEQTSDPVGTDLVDTAYDGLGRNATVSNPYRSTSDPTYGITTYAYDALGRTTQVKRPDGSMVNTTYTGAATEVQDEGNGNGSSRVTRISQADGLGHMTSVCEVTSASLTGLGGTPSSCGQDISGTGFLTQYSYDALGDLLAVTQNGLNSRSFVYDSLGRLTSGTNPESGTITYQYDGNNNVTSRTAPDQNHLSGTVTATYQYDPDNHLTGKSFNDGTTPSVTYVYNTGQINGLTLLYPTDRLVEISADNGNSVIWNSYDQMGRISNQWQCVAINCGGTPFELSYGYDYLGDVTSGTNGLGVTMSYGYDEAQHLTQATSSWNNPPNYPSALFGNGMSEQYNAGGELESALLGNGLTETNTYNNRMRMTQDQVGTSGSAYSLSMSYAPNGDVLTANDSANGNWTYTYDDFNRLVASSQNSGQNAYSYGYDRFGNRWSQSVTAGSGYNSSLAYDANNRITSGITYEAAGNMGLANTGNGSTYDFVHDAEFHVLWFSLGGPPHIATYAYDGLGRRIQKTVGSTTDYYLYDLMGHQIAEVDNNGDLVRGEVYAGGKHLATYADGTTYFDHGDHVGTERARTTATGGGAETCQSLPFGDGMSCTGNDISPMHFMGKERDPESNLDAFGARFYSSTYGRWMSPDWSAAPEPVPYANLSNPQTLNLYALVQDNPETFADLDGHEVLAGANQDNNDTNSLDACSGAWNYPCDGINPGVGETQAAQAAAVQQGEQQQNQQNQNSNTPPPSNPDGTPKPPPVPPPPGEDGKPNEWVPVDGTGGDRTEKWKPRDSVPSADGKGGQPGASWDGKRGHWDIDDGNRNRTRYLPDGTKVDHHNNPIPMQAVRTVGVIATIGTAVGVVIQTFPEWGPVAALAF
jgi:RHS repeat-associated protein